MTVSRPSRALRLAAYHGLARWLPPGTAPPRQLWKWARLVVAGPLFESVGRDVNIEHGAFFGTGATLRIGHRSGLGVNSRMHGPVDIGNDVMMGPEVLVYAHGHSRDRTDIPMIDQGFAEPRPVTIEDDVWVGARAVILPGVTIGTGSIIGAGAVVARDVPPYSVAVGNPARVVSSRRRTAADDIDQA